MRENGWTSEVGIAWRDEIGLNGRTESLKALKWVWIFQIWMCVHEAETLKKFKNFVVNRKLKQNRHGLCPEGASLCFIMRVCAGKRRKTCKCTFSQIVQAAKRARNRSHPCHGHHPFREERRSNQTCRRCVPSCHEK